MNDLPKYGLTIWWPWCTAITHGSKRIENRSWEPGQLLGKRIAIHCGKTEDEDAAMSIALEPDIDWHPDDGPQYDEVAGCIIGTARIVGWINEEENTSRLLGKPSHLGAEVPDHESKVLTTMHRSPWFAGPAGWILDEIRQLDDPIAARGMPGFFDVEEAIEKERSSGEAEEDESASEDDQESAAPSPQVSLFAGEVVS